MSRMDGWRQTGTPYDKFLYAELGCDRAGHTVSVLSALARLGLDPWAEARELSAMTQDGARDHLRLVLDQFHDVPELDHGGETIISELVDALPRATQKQTRQGFGKTIGASDLGPYPIGVALLVILVLAQSVLSGLGAAGD